VSTADSDRWASATGRGYMQGITGICPRCHGLGRTAIETLHAGGPGSVETFGYVRATCPDCDGTGWEREEG
jgi:phage FluMu protein Com